MNKNGFVIVSFGGLLKVDRLWVYEKLLAAFDQFPELKFIIKHRTGENSTFDELFSAHNKSFNLLTMDWLPQKELLGIELKYRFQYSTIVKLNTNTGYDSFLRIISNFIPVFVYIYVTKRIFNSRKCDNE